MADRRNVRRKKPNPVPPPIVVAIAESHPTVTSGSDTSMKYYTFAPPEPPRKPCLHERWAAEVRPAAAKHLEHYYQLSHVQWAWDRDREMTYVPPEWVFCVDCGIRRSEVI